MSREKATLRLYLYLACSALLIGVWLGEEYVWLISLDGEPFLNVTVAFAQNNNGHAAKIRKI